jgi:hypothetical protein
MADRERLFCFVPIAMADRDCFALCQLPWQTERLFCFVPTVVAPKYEHLKAL